MSNILHDIELDALDRRILKVLQSNGRITNQQLSERVNLSASACSRRVAHLEEAGVIAGYAALIAPSAVDRATTVFVQVTLTRQKEGDMAAFEAAVADCPDIMECYLMSGEADYLVKVAVRDLHDYERVHAQYLSRFPAVARIHSSFTLRTVKKETAFQIGP
ncbi:Lrp/AsnC family transcriptional regulator [Ferruginivarius sediminum]|uniref:Lrp/AsnC family transcriptional regulator n=1 Tax=Ferruginivarius sediminum TaxID=2661937 RepID=UPI00137B5554|nr:Lrp/AsnC family transcriptional regulator [Ferruginivarius sediminum]